MVPDERPRRVGGQIGAPMARHLIGWEGGLTVFDVRAEACEPFAGAAIVATTPAEVAARSDVISLMVLDDAQVSDVLAGDDGLLDAARPGTVVAVHSTIAADTAIALAATAADVDVEIIDAPVSGGAMGAHAGTLAVMAGGTAAAVERSRPVFERWAGLVAHLGPVGSGTRAKLARNLLQFTALAAVGEAQRLAEAAGIDPAALGEVVRHSDAVAGGPGAIMLRSRAGAMADDDPLRPFFEHTLEPRREGSRPRARPGRGSRPRPAARQARSQPTGSRPRPAPRRGGTMTDDAPADPSMTRR
jgi:3-hydroxyisobutyrate dehydrogenase